MLTGDEWKLVEPVHLRSTEATGRTREQTGLALPEALGMLAWSDGRDPALVLFEQITGMRETNRNAVWHHRVSLVWHHRASLYGPDCLQCGKPLPTPRARWCAFCGTGRV